MTSQLIVLTITEAEQIVRVAVRSDARDFDTFDAIVQLQALAGCVQVVRAMQELGWHVSRPPTGEP